MVLQDPHSSLASLVAFLDALALPVEPAHFTLPTLIKAKITVDTSLHQHAASIIHTQTFLHQSARWIKALVSMLTGGSPVETVVELLQTLTFVSVD